MASNHETNGDRKRNDENATMFQSYEWNIPNDKKHWQRLVKVMPGLKEVGINNFWLPPGCKASSDTSNGYDIYDLYDLGEFDQKGGKGTRYGTKEELLALSKKAKETGVGLYWDAVLNHKASADQIEKTKVVEVDENDRTKDVSEPYEIDAWLGFDFKGRGDKYSSQKYHWYHFSGTDFNQANQKKAIYKIVGDNKGWSDSVTDAQGNGDFLMFADLDYSHPEVEEDVKKWGAWILKEVDGLKGFRLDAVQHFSQRFTKNFVDYVTEQCGDQFWVGEYLVGDPKIQCKWLEEMDHKFSLYDSALVNNFHEISTSEDADLRKVFDKSLVAVKPVNAVTFVQNHDTQPGQTVEIKIEDFFKPLAYALILLRQEGYPCVFYGDLYGILGEHKAPPSCGGKIADMTLARNLYAYGNQEDYWDNKNYLGFVRRGTWDRPFGLACIMSNAKPARLRMSVGTEHIGEVWTDVLGWADKEVKIDDEGYGEFDCGECSVSIYVKKEADGRDRFGKFNDKIYED